jgi:hypothetical protein
MRKNTKKLKTIMKKTINNTIEKERGGGGVFDSLEAALEEKSNIKGG